MKLKTLRGAWGPCRGEKMPASANMRVINLLLQFTHACLPLPPSQPLQTIPSMPLLHIIMINKNQSKRNSVPEEQFQSSSPPAHNTTTSKQRNSMRRMQEEVQQSPLQDRPWVEDSPIEADTDRHQISPQDNCVSSPRRSLIKQNELWAVGEGSVVHSHKVDLKAASEEYYNENVPQQTLIFLERLRSVLIREEEGLVQRRRGKLQSAVTAIRSGFARLREQLLAAVEGWSRRVEEVEVEEFLQRGQLAVSGELLEVTARMAARREEIELRLSSLNEGLAQTQLTPREEVLHRNRLVKQTVREVWLRDYQQEVLQLQEEASLLKISESTHRIMLQRSQHYRQTLHAAIDEVFSNHEPFKITRENSRPAMSLSPPVRKKNEEESLSPPSTHREQILQSLMEERMREINLESRRLIAQYQLETD